MSTKNEESYQWACEISLLTNMTMLLHSQKLMMRWGIGIGVFLAVVRLLLGNATFVEALLTIAIVILGFSALGLVGYVIYCCIRGGGFTSSYTLDKKNLRENYVPYKVQKLPNPKGLSGLIDILSSRPGLPGWGFVWATGKSTSTVPLKRVRTIKARRRLGHIKVSLGLDHVYVYVRPTDFDTILNYLREHCPQARVSGSG